MSGERGVAEFPGHAGVSWKVFSAAESKALADSRTKMRVVTKGLVMMMQGEDGENAGRVQLRLKYTFNRYA
jgi:hypothetical protein